MRSTRIIRQVSNEVKKAATRERQTVADPFLYHTKPPSAFWEKFRVMMAINPESSSSGMQLNEVFRSPPPASVQTVQVTPASKASDLAENPYHERDFRRMYPRLEMVTQTDLASLLIAAPERMQLPSPSSSGSSTSVTPVTSGSDNKASLASLYISSSTSASTFVPPKPPGKPYRYSIGEQPPHDKNAHFPMVNYR
ncbi:hypothetical protein MJO28_012642 [Puccinia striiformis f. sp. tritici]|uniref:Uncharacterized protein n=4 Tax=Puccinia striiformis TaxID=27350 RepID=A0A0L0VZ64_9BASI|nr:hypothetical protein Pst134EA_022485 [Puccinia striiformis f. sp. tritici]KAI9605625.1 hypothetical protein H4Q26_003990 [Puccinia striiformis f. sp. tritici PST-130]KNF04482.1 hypothetical protein PSTG_02393 [Puccinia striiformis f. sp. tritici PST-78]POV97434.1 hypothetical protein PSTT_15052 [Puccinia striiformis]KAH9445531.1 hypothetical protein Pst134EB_023373 [Puccinia striiformis f. sp. tritici]KAH9454998.1 hypothetical protein Pst134EA_022485 [Puccinia striiformis f. sp. tritici]